MSISILQLNINADIKWENLLSYLEDHEYDILTFQEVAGIGTKVGNINCTHDTYKELQNKLQEKYAGELVITDYVSSSENAYFGNAIFYKKTFNLIDKHVKFMKQNTQPFPSDAKGFENYGRAVLHLTLEKDNQSLSVLTTHFAWAKTSNEEPHQTQQGEILFQYMQTVSHPFVLTGDFNLTPEQPVIKKLSTLARNLTSQNNISNTLNPRIHYAQHLFPKGLAIDYIFVTPDIRVKEMKVIEDLDLSDHLAVEATVEI